MNVIVESSGNRWTVDCLFVLWIVVGWFCTENTLLWYVFLYVSMFHGCGLFRWLRKWSFIFVRCFKWTTEYPDDCWDVSLLHLFPNSWFDYLPLMSIIFLFDDECWRKVVTENVKWVRCSCCWMSDIFCVNCI